MKTIRIGTRASKLALAQAQMVADSIAAHAPAIHTELVPMKTTGDKILDRPLDRIGGKGLFVKELDQALADGQVDITVHSSKDLPMQLDASLPIVAASLRENPLDVLVLPVGASALNRTKPVGCASARRRIQLAKLYPGVQVQPVRGNVGTRLEKLDRGEYGALVLAAAGLVRLSLQERISRVFAAEEMLPAAGQGIVAVQARAGEDTGYLAAFHSEESMWCLLAERAFVRALDGGCSKPCAAYAVINSGGILLRGMYVSDDESIVRYGSVQCELQTAEQQATALAERMKQECRQEK